MEKDKQLYLKLFTSTFYLSAFTFGGGYVIIPMMKKKFVDDLHWIEEKEMLDMIAISQSSPGAMAVNTSIIVGYRIAGILGAMVTVLGTILPPLIILSVISLFYEAFRDNVIVNAVLKGMQAGVAAVIADVVITMGGDILRDKEWLSIIIMISAFCAVYFLKINIIYIILSCALIGAVTSILRNRKERKIK